MIVLRAFAVVLGYAAAVFGGGWIVESGVRRLLRPGDAEEIRTFQDRGLRDGGKIIGWLERFLFLTLWLVGAHAAIGFVLAAKGLIRYGEIRDEKDHKVAEYILIGSLASLSWAILVGIALKWLVG